MPANTRVLVVEDDKVLSATLAEQLSPEEYEASVVGDGEAAIEEVKKNPFDIVILDLKIPKIDGFQVLKFIKQSYPAVKVIVLTAYADLKNVSLCKELGADDIVEKPYELGDLFEAIDFVRRK